jgi:hypothetical protein
MGIKELNPGLRTAFSRKNGLTEKPSITQKGSAFARSNPTPFVAGVRYLDNPLAEWRNSPGYLHGFYFISC